MTKQFDPAIRAGDRPAQVRSVMFSGRSLYDSDHFRDRVDALQKRWEDRFSIKDAQSIGESYANGRISFVFDFEMSGTSKGGQLPARRHRNFDRTKRVIAHVINCAKSGDLIHNDCWDDEVMFVDIIGLTDFPKKKIPSFVRFL